MQSRQSRPAAGLSLLERGDRASISIATTPHLALTIFLAALSLVHQGVDAGHTDLQDLCYISQAGVSVLAI